VPAVEPARPATHIPETPVTRASLVRRPLAAALLLAVPAAVGAQGAAPAAPAATPDSAVLVTRLGVDTLAIERFVRTPRRVEAQVLLRTPRTSLTRYVMLLDAQGNMTRLESSMRDPLAPADAPPLRAESVVRKGDSLVVTITPASGEATTRTVAAVPRTLPFLDMIHWPFEVALVREAGVAGGTERELPLLSGRSVSRFGLEILTPDSVAITHPTRGTQHARVDRQGRLLALDAAGTTRALTVERRPWMDLAPIAERYAAADRAGRSFGALAGRAERADTVRGATLSFDYGTPVKRGREIWGALVPWDRVWRTGANMATHFTTDRTLVLGDPSLGTPLVVPAGRYTFFSIPSASGGTLIVNRQTGQNGQAYDAKQDLGRVPMQIRKLAEPVEVFTIEATESARGGELALKWDRAAFVVPFTVRPN
jgi:hypothetical protein